MPRIHFIAIGGNVMHQLAITLARKGYQITGSDDEIFEPALSNLQSAGLLPKELGWYPLKIPVITAIFGNKKWNLGLLSKALAGYSSPSQTITGTSVS